MADHPKLVVEVDEDLDVVWRGVADEVKSTE
jgi:hypothetical protein